MITYGSGADPGVEWAILRHDYDIASIAPPERMLSGGGFWAGDMFPQKDLVSPTKVALYNLKDFEGLPGMMVQVNLFSCGGYGIGIKLAHQLADARSMTMFIHEWAANSQSIFEGRLNSSLSDAPLFDPSQLDSRAAGEIDGQEADEDIVRAARKMPIHRFSWWDTEEPGYPPWFAPSSKNCIPPADILAETKLSPSTIAPWKTWDPTRPVSWGLVHLAGDELMKLQQMSREAAPTGCIISKTDALMAFMFRMVTRARSYAQSDDDEVFLNVPVDARRRVSPPLPEKFLGSPLLMTHIKSSASAVRDSSLGELAVMLRETLMLFTPDRIAGILHDAAYEVSPQRLWPGFMGTLHIIATPWQRLRLYEVDFDGSGSRPAYVHAVMTKCDGTIVILDSIAPDGGVDIAVYLDAETMEHFKEELSKERLPWR
jgi:hypothetical protein